MDRLPNTMGAKSLLARIAFWASKRKLGRVVEPLRVYALSTPVLYGYGQMELAHERMKRVPAHLLRLAQIRVATRIGCPF